MDLLSRKTEKKRKDSQETNTEGAQSNSNTTIDARKQSIERQPTDQTNKRKDPPQLNTAEISQGLTIRWAWLYELNSLSA